MEWAKAAEDCLCIHEVWQEAYGSNEPLNVLGTFWASTKVAGNEVQAEFVSLMVKEKQLALQLGVLKLGVPVYTL